MKSHPSQSKRQRDHQSLVVCEPIDAYFKYVTYCNYKTPYDGNENSKKKEEVALHIGALPVP
jgi:hypothetical protein